MVSQIIKHCDTPHQFEPLMPEESELAPLLERASDLARGATALGSASGKTAQLELRALLRSMNSYYTNRIEGEHTRPSDIERALQQDFSANADLARKQRLAVAHIRTEQSCEAEVDRRVAAAGEDGARWLYSSQALTLLHGALFSDLPADDLELSDGSLMMPGQIRKKTVAVGRHKAPTPKSLAKFIDRWAQAYGRVRRGEASIVALAASWLRRIGLGVRQAALRGAAARLEVLLPGAVARGRAGRGAATCRSSRPAPCPAQWRPEEREVVAPHRGWQQRRSIRRSRVS